METELEKAREAYDKAYAEFSEQQFIRSITLETSENFIAAREVLAQTAITLIELQDRELIARLAK